MFRAIICICTKRAIYRKWYYILIATLVALGISVSLNQIFSGRSLLEINFINDGFSASILSRGDLNLGQSNPARSGSSECSLSYLKRFVNTHHTYAEMSFAEIAKHDSESNAERTTCSFPQAEATPLLEACSKNKTIRSILMLGDSNGGRYFKAALDFFSTAKWACRGMLSDLIEEMS